MSRPLQRTTLLLAGLLVLHAATAALHAGDPPGGEPDEESDPAALAELSIEPPNPGPPVIQAPKLPWPPPAGKGRVRLEVSGNRRWCTSPDDRVVKPPEGMRPTGAPKPRNTIYTYGYQFTVAAVARADPGLTLLLFESPVFRTAVLRQAAKLGKGARQPPQPTTIGVEGEGRPLRMTETPNTLLPYWQEQYRCATLHNAFEFDLDPGVYDIYMAFDTLTRSGSWAHRSIGFLTEVEIRPGRITGLDGLVDMAAGSRRDVEIRGATLLPAAGAGAP